MCAYSLHFIIRCECSQSVHSVAICQLQLYTVLKSLKLYFFSFVSMRRASTESHNATRFPWMFQKLDAILERMALSDFLTGPATLATSSFIIRSTSAAFSCIFTLSVAICFWDILHSIEQRIAYGSTLLCTWTLYVLPTTYNHTRFDSSKRDNSVSSLADA